MRFSEEVNSRLREYIITQMLKLFRFILAVNNIEDSGTKTFDEVCADERTEFIHTQTYDIFDEYYDRPNLYIPNFTCLWDIIFNTFSSHKNRPYTSILSAYCRSNDINTKKDLYIKMSAELERWVNTITRFEDIVILAIGMSKNRDIWWAFQSYSNVLSPFLTDAVDILIKNNFENIHPEIYTILPIKPIQTKYDDPRQHAFCEYIMRKLNYFIKSHDPKSLNLIYEEFSYIIRWFGITIPDEHTNLQLENIDQILEYFVSKIPQYPVDIKDYLSILMSGYITTVHNKCILTNLTKMAELSNYNLRNLPIDPIIAGYGGSTPLDEIPLEQIPEYYARLTHNYSGTHTKAARR